MIPPTLLQQLSRLRTRERWLRLAWGAALALAVFSVVLAVLCLVDWLIDLKQDTPYALRRAMLIGQVILWGVGAAWLMRWVLLRRLQDEALALWVEERVPEFGHRLISALQLNRPGAATQGMSPAMIGAVTREAEEHVARRDFAGLADHRRLYWSIRLLAPLLVVVLGVFLVWPHTVLALVARQFLLERDIPRSVQLESVTVPVWPSGEEVVLRFRVSHGGDDEDVAPSEGVVRVDPDDSTSERYPLIFEGTPERGQSIYTTRVRATTVNFGYRAWLKDGRTRRPLHIQMEPRPAIVQLDAYVRLPAYTGLKPDGQPYEILQPRGDVAGVPDTTARVAVVTQKPIEKATLELLGRPTNELLLGLPGAWIDPPGVPLAGILPWLVRYGALTNQDAPSEGQAAPTAVGPEMVLRRIPMTLAKGGMGAAGTFDLRPGESIYRVVVEDRYRFVNLDAPRRTIRLVAEEPPLVALLPERFAEPGRAATEEDEVEGVPILFLGNFRIAYTCSTPYGLGKAQFRYRTVREGAEDGGGGEWWTLPLAERPATETSGPFDPRKGAFIASGFFDEIEFHGMPSADLTRFPPRTDGGGRFDFKTRALQDLKIGAKIEFYIEVFDRNPDPNRAPGRSEIRQKTIVNLDEYLAWKEHVLQQESRIRQLETRQRAVFNVKAPPDDPVVSKPVTRPDLLPRNPDATGFVRSWQIVGPFAARKDKEKSLDFVYLPESEKIDLGKTYSGTKMRLGWRAYHSLGDRIDLEKILQHSDAGVAYAVCWVRSPEAAKAILATGSDDGIKVWIDRQEVLAKHTRREAVAGEDKTPISLKENEWHELLVKVDNRTGSWAFFFQLLDPQTGKGLDGLRFRITPPEDPGSSSQRFVRSWLMIGPFPNAGDDGRDKPFPPETEKVDISKEFDGSAGKVRWKPYTSETGRIGFDKFFDRPFNESNLAYAVCWVRCDADTKAILATGSDDGIRVWVNRKQVLNKAVSRELKPGDDTEPIQLQKGWNEVLVKVDNRFGRWGFYLELRDAKTELPLEGVEYRATPPE